ncbi:MAG: branched-chain amino acid ABC transporter permease [Spirochaetes bacterium]|nr:branched-chain amino acid ABC transporter permease [Spirochaetota bacterium]
MLRLNQMKVHTKYIAGLIVVIFFVLCPLFLNSERSYFIYFLYTTFIYITIAQGWNLIAGYTGQVSLGQHAFFGLGAYITAITWRAGLTGYFDPLAFLLSGTGALLLAAIVGVVLLSKLRDDYFSLGTLGIGEILRVAALNGGSFTEGAAGISLNSTAYKSMNHYYYTALFIMLFTLVVIVLLIRSRVGLALIAIREDETAASANGIPVLRYKILAFSIGAFVTGLCGSLNAYYIFHVHPPGVLSLNWVVIPVLMCILGGAGTFMGPILGAFVLSIAFELTSIWMPEIHPIFSGAFIVLVTLFMPSGIMYYITNHKSMIMRRLRLTVFKWMNQKA